MTLTREALASYLDSQFSALAAAIGQDADPLLGYEPDIDLALRKLGKSRDELASATLEDSQEEAAFALAEYYAARRFWRQLGDRVNRSTGKVSFNFTNQLATAQAIMEDAAAKCAALGYDVAGSGWGVGYLNLDWIENEVTT
jgi:hypothetical protein